MKILKPVSMNSDERGIFSCLISGGTKKYADLNYCETKAGNIRGNHYHKNTDELFIILSGEIELLVEKIMDNKILYSEKCEFGKFDIFIINTYENHTITAKTDCSWISLLTVPFEENNMDFWKL